MMNQLNNWLCSIRTYADLSPDLTIRRQINQQMEDRGRSLLDLTDWCALFSCERVDRPVLAFVYRQFSDYSGIEFGRIRPGDQLIADLQLPLVCWHDWAIDFCEDFCNQFQVDLSDRFDEANFDTVGELVAFLIDQAPQEQALRAVSAGVSTGQESFAIAGVR
ncbi:MAG: hypothetical protein AAFP20_03015 [Cyanobacteria bacterium J06614_10]